MMRQIQARALPRSHLYSFPLTLTVFGLLAACVSASGHPEWIHVGVTTKHEVIASPGGDTAIYRPTASGPSRNWKFPPPKQVPSEQPPHVCNRSILV
jgi:hypothetical protein